MKTLLPLALGLSLALGSALAPPLAGQSPAAAAATATNDFGFELYAKLRRADANVVVSPVSVGVALAMLANGANGETLAALTKALEMDGAEIATLNRRMKALCEAITTTRRPPRGLPMIPFELTMANCAWANDDVPIVPDFIAALDAHYGAEARSSDFADPATREAINGWVKEKTLGRIPSIIDRLSDDDLMILINTLTFTGQWREPFKSQLTRPMTFTTSHGPKTVPMMRHTGNLAYVRDDAAGRSAVRFDYAGGQARMTLVLPDRGKPMSAFTDDLSDERWRALVRSMAFRRGTVRLPRMNVQYHARLKEALRAMGLGILFRRTDGLSGISPVNPFVAEVIHKTSLEVDEKGTKAAAATAIRLRKGRAPGEAVFDLTFDRPFFCTIEHRLTGAILFMGVIDDPGVEAEAKTEKRGKSKRIG